MNTEPIIPCTYIIRLWKEPVLEVQEHQWRFVLINTTASEKRGFATIDDLIKQLQEELISITNDTQQ